MITLLVVSITSMVVNLTANVLVIYILIKTKQLSNITFKLIFSLTTSDMLMTLTSQSLLAMILHEKSCWTFLSVFFYHFGSYIVALLGVDRYIRIKHYSNFRNILTTKVATILIIAIFFLASLQASMITLSSKLQEYKISLSLYIAVDGIIVVLVAFLQRNTIQTSNALHSEATVSNSERINKKITKLSMRIMLLLHLYLTAPNYVSCALRDWKSFKWLWKIRTWICFNIFNDIWIDAFTNRRHFIFKNQRESETFLEKLYVF